MPSNLNTTFDWPNNFSNGTAITGIGTMFQYASYVTEGFFGLGILLIIFLISLIGGMMFGVRRALASSSFITFIFSVYLLRMELVPTYIPFVLIFMAILGAIGSKSESGNI